MIHLDRVSRWYVTPSGRKHVLRDVTVTIPKGVNVGIFGLNGSGKSTLLRLLGGTDQPDRGRITIDGSISWPLGLGTGFQGSMTGLDNTRFVCGIHGLDPRTTDRVCAFVEDFSELGKDFRLPARHYSSGMKSRLTFSMSIAFDFDWYLIDEITAVGDEVFRKKSAQVLRAKRGRCNWLMVSHNVVDLMQETDIGILVDGGDVQIFTDSRAALLAYQALIKQRTSVEHG